jgi:hypothetical protein
MDARTLRRTDAKTLGDLPISPWPHFRYSCHVSRDTTTHENRIFKVTSHRLDAWLTSGQASVLPPSVEKGAGYRQDIPRDSPGVVAAPKFRRLLGLKPPKGDEIKHPIN